ncbi:MAG: hypothetical protein SNJ67_06720 [Chloracidobacterium sp.]|uniref:Nif11 domain-containing protein n=1 Tax=Chloracidobacterium validum TaxID=2821543 RepID=A0ABX8B842_9BACT|nr:hypothetical protein [Chloracidobacterium validum]QUW03117.1 hypothetical protein J8C06_01340 [Chloracidobacterium validum]
MSSPQFEAFLARLYADASFREEFLAAPETVAKAFGLSAQECAAVATIDLTGLELAARVFAKKLDYKAEHQRQQGWRTRLRRWWRDRWAAARHYKGRA